ncbi:homing endonuclease associated repeat-containing protein [Halobaculum sp. P14]|uniref:homing endonuclease associated repeat-containing protein n=1 Tax=Halobaculum sp. P14 TaxID=3421638 RepID=UPI003EBE540D
MRYSDDDLLADIRDVASKLGTTPTLQTYREHGSHSASTMYDRFGSWRDAVDAAGFDPHDPMEKISDEDLIEELRRLRDELGSEPSAGEMNEHGKYWVSTYRNHFESWSAARRIAFVDEE